MKYFREVDKLLRGVTFRRRTSKCCTWKTLLGVDLLMINSKLLITFKTKFKTSMERSWQCKTQVSRAPPSLEQCTLGYKVAKSQLGRLNLATSHLQYSTICQTRCFQRSSLTCFYRSKTQKSNKSLDTLNTMLWNIQKKTNRPINKLST